MLAFQGAARAPRPQAPRAPRTEVEAMATADSEKLCFELAAESLGWNTPPLGADLACARVQQVAL